MILSAILGAIFGLGLIFMFLMYPAKLWKTFRGENVCTPISNFIIRFHKCIGTVVLIATILYLLLCFNRFPFSWMVLITMLLFIMVAISGYFVKKGEKNSWKQFHQWGSVVLLVLTLLYTKIK